MHITGITVSNFVGLPHFEHQPTAPVLFVAGGNGAGKTSLLEAVRFALTGATPRGCTKASERPELITEGAATGHVIVATGNGSYRRAIASGKLSGDAPTEPLLEYCLDTTQFAQLAEADRRKLLFGLAKVKVDRDTVAEQLRAGEISSEAIAHILPKLANGFPAAASFARDEATAARGAWKAVTGEAYGSQKAATWTANAEGEAPTDAELDEEAIAIGRYEARIVDLAQAAGRASAAVSEERRQELADLVEGLPKAQLEQADAQDRYDAAAAEVTRLEGAARGHTPKIQDCPNCGAHLIATSDGLCMADLSDETPPVDAGALNKAKAAAHDAYGELQRCRKAVWHHEAAKTTLETLPPAPTEDDLQAGEKLVEERKKCQVHRDALALLERRRTEHRNAERLTADAAKHHAAAVEWVAAEKQLGPDGIPAILLARALDPINEALANMARSAGWAPAAISRELTLTYGGRAYALVSESEQWRADAMFAAVIAQLSGSRILLLDRFDVLEPAARGGALDWLCQITDADDVVPAVDTVIVAGTLKAKPDLGDGIDVVWIGKESASE